nr:cobaltochelatase subunit CobN [Actinomycetota bacterium]
MILFLTNADTEILALRSVVEGLPEGFPRVRAANPARLDEAPDLDGVELVIVRLLGGRRSWAAPFDALRAGCMARRVPLVALGGESVPDAELAALSTADAPVVARSFEYLAQGGLANTANLLRYLAGHPHELPVELPAAGLWPTRAAPNADARPAIGIVFYRAHVLSGNTGFVDDLCAAIEERGARPVPVWCYSLRPGEDGSVPALDLLAGQGVDAVITTVLAMGAATDDDWDASALANLDVPIIQAVAATQPRAAWEASSAGLTPVDVAMSVAIPEFDGRIVGVPFSFKEVVDDGDELGAPVTAYRTVADRVARVAGIAARQAALRHKANPHKRVAIVLSAYPTKRSRIGNAVGLDTPASVIDLLHSLRAAGYRVDRIPHDGDSLMAELADKLTYDRESLSPQQSAAAAGRLPAETYGEWFGGLPEPARTEMVAAWGPPPGVVFRDGDDLVFPGLDLGNVVVAVQPPRGFGQNPIAIYHSPDLAPTHHYLAFYHWLDQTWGADAVVHAGKHGTLEWLPGKGVGLSSGCYPDAALGDLPLLYPFVVNDPGEGTQAKRRAHAVIVDHLVPPMTRADTYDDLARLESLLDEYARIASLDPAKLPAIRAQVWALLVEAEIHRDLGLDGAPDDESFDDLVLHVDGYLCELKDAQIRGGLHILGRPPRGDAEIDLILAMTRLPQGSVPALREAATGRHDVDAAEARARAAVGALQADDWCYEGDDPTLRWVCDRLVPALARTTDEVANLLRGLDGRHVAAGPSGAPTRGMAHVLPTGRNFYSVDPKAIPSRLAWEVGCGLADEIVSRHIAEEGRPPGSVGLVVWGTSAMRTSGDDVAEALALLGVRPVWASESARVTGVELIPLEELGRP